MLSPLKYKEKNQNSNIHHEVNYNWSHLTSDEYEYLLLIKAAANVMQSINITEATGG